MIRVPPILLLSALGVTATALAQSDGHAPAPSVAPAATHRYALTLLSSFDPIPDNAVPADVKGQRVYRTQSTVFGKTIYFLRLGFFTSAAEAEAAKNQLNARFPGAFVSEITPVEYAEAGHVLPQAPKPAAVPIPRPEPASTPAAVARETLYAITLASGGAGALHPVGPLPDALQSSRLYTHAIKSNGKALGTLNLGFFATAAEAESARRLLATTYPQAQVHAVSRQEKESSENNQLVAPSSPKVTAPAALPPQPSTAENPVDKQAAQLMERGRAALTRGDNPGAIAALNQLLRLPPNRHSQDAQELIGLAHERNNEKILAKQEYALYLKLYPEGDGAERVRQRLAILESPESAPALKAVRQKQTDITMAYGSFSQYYYRGDTHTETGTTVSPLLNQSSLTTTDQSALITNLDFTGRMRSGDYDNRVVVRDGYTSNFLANTENVNRLYSAYFEIKDKALDYSGRLGRQPGNSGGVLGRFDGVSLGYGLLPKWRVNVVAGEPVELINPISSTRQFWGASLDMGTFAEHWNSSVYYINQTVDGIIDRQAVGSELRYYAPTRSLLTLVDYDVSYSALNIALLQGTWQMAPGTNWNLLVDHRKAPVLQTSNALIGEPVTSISTLLQTMTEDQLRAQAVDRTPTSRLFTLGITHNFSPKWQLGGNVQMYSISGTPASGSLPGTPGTGDMYIYTLQGIATGLLTKRDISVLGLSYVTGPSYDGSSVFLDNRSLLQDRWTIDLSLRYYQQTDNLGVEMTRWTPMLRTGYRWRERITFEAEAGVELTHTASSIQTQDDTRTFFMLGYRWEF